MRRLCNYPCQTIMNTLKFQDVLESNIVIKGIAIVESTANENKNSCNIFGNSKRQMDHSPKLSDSLAFPTILLAYFFI